MASNGMKIAIVGGGLAGLAAAMKIAEAGNAVDLFSVVPVKRSHSVCAQGGINGAVNTKGEGDSTWEHFDDTVYGGDFLANQPPAKAMCEMAPAIIYLFDRMGVPFSRTNEGLLDFRRFGGTKHHRTAFAGASTGQQLLYALDEQVRKHEVSGKVRKFEHWEMLSLVLDDHQVCRGLIAMDLQTLELKVVSGRCSDYRDRWSGINLRKVNKLDGLYWKCGIGLLSAGRKVCEWRIHPGTSHVHSWRRQASTDVRISTRRRRKSLGAAQTRDSRSPSSNS